MPGTVRSTSSTVPCLILTAKPQSGPWYHLHITDQETEVHGGEGAHPGSQLSSSGSESNPDSSDSTASCTMLPFIHISTQEIFTYWLIRNLSTLMPPRLFLCMSICVSQMPTLLNNISIIPTNNLSSGDGDLQTANSPEGEWELGLFKCFLRSGSSSMPHCSICIFCCWACGERSSCPIMENYPCPGTLSLAAGFLLSQRKLADRHWWYLRIDACQVVLLLWQ